MYTCDVDLPSLVPETMYSGSFRTTRGQVQSVKSPCLVGDPSMECHGTVFRPPTSSLHSPSPHSGHLFKLYRSPALLHTHTPGNATSLPSRELPSPASGPPLSPLEFRPLKLPEFSVGQLAIFFFLWTGTPGGTPKATSQRPVGSRTRGFVCVKTREENFHTSQVSHRLSSVRLFPEHSESSRPHMSQDHTGGGRTDTENHLNE